MTDPSQPFVNIPSHEELLRVAILDMQAGRHQEAISRLSQLISQAPGNAYAHCLLGAEHAELGLFDRAAASYETAILLNPSLTVAHFQLGLTYYVRNDFARANTCWARLKGLPESAAVEAFGRALILAAQQRKDEALEAIATGMASQPSDGLLQDMQRIRASLEAPPLRQLRQRPRRALPLTTPSAPCSAFTRSSRMLLTPRSPDVDR